MRDLRPEVQAFLDRVQAFIDAEIRPNESTYCLLYTSPSPRDRTRSRMPSSA